MTRQEAILKYRGAYVLAAFLLLLGIAVAAFGTAVGAGCVLMFVAAVISLAATSLILTTSDR